MKAATLTSLLVTSAAAGAAAAGGPFFFAQTTPIAFYQSTWTTTNSGTELVYPIQPNAMVITDISTTHGGSGQYVLSVNGVDAWTWDTTNSSHQSYRDGRISLQHGIPVPAGSQVKIKRYGNYNPAISISGYLF